ncbi:unnamed protein product [Rotaria sp. Silwood2]|nr:unnamed protein product [Rotaria sp. Silwood2]CAF4053757.1 unnamed protein product [Rotaria sp. Silwood2]
MGQAESDFKALGNAFEDAGRAIQQGVQEAGNVIADGVCENIGRPLEAAGNAVGDTFQNAGDFIPKILPIFFPPPYAYQTYENQEELDRLKQEHDVIIQQHEELLQKMEEEKLNTFEQVATYEKIGVERFQQLAATVQPLKMERDKNLALFGITSTGKSTMINSLLGQKLAETGYGEITKVIQPYDGQSYRLYDVPGKNDDVSYFTVNYISFWKGLSYRLIIINHTVKEMTKVIKLLDAIQLQYDLIVNKFDQVPPEERDQFKQQIRDECQECQLQGVNHLWFVNAQRPQQFQTDWIEMVNYLTN